MLFLLFVMIILNVEDDETITTLDIYNLLMTIN
jgi:hypothetical protein